MHIFHLLMSFCNCVLQVNRKCIVKLFKMLQKVNSTCDGGYQLYCSNLRICGKDIHSITAKTHGLTKASKSCGTILVALQATASNNVGNTTLVETLYLSVHLISEHLQVGNCVYAMSSVPLPIANKCFLVRYTGGHVEFSLCKKERWPYHDMQILFTLSQFVDKSEFVY